jgi:hypothetical protein
MMRIVLSNNRYWPVVIILLLYFLIGCERHIVYTINTKIDIPQIYAFMQINTLWICMIIKET